MTHMVVTYVLWELTMHVGPNTANEESLNVITLSVESN